MNVLIIGNGFDRAHKLPTTYIDFMNYLAFCKNIKASPDGFDLLKNSGYKLDSFTQLESGIRELVKQFIKEDRKDELLPEHISKLVSYDNKNCWYEYFNSIIEGLPENYKWVDFEARIGEVIQKIELGIMKGFSDSFENQDASLIMLMNFHKQQGPKTMDEYVECIRRDLDEFIKCLDEYSVIINKVSDYGKYRLKCIQDIEVDAVVSFNYTETFTKYYGCKGEVDIEYVHGKAGESFKEDISNLVVGCAETLEGDSRDKILDCGYFKKYLQRDIKATGRQYRKFYDGTNASENVLYIFGHSLDVNDGDIIKYMIDHSEKVVVFYYSTKDIIGKAQNLVRILTKDGYEDARWKLEYKYDNSLYNIDENEVKQTDE